MNLQISKEILNLVPYKPGESDKDVKAKYGRDFFVKLASNESPLPPSEKVMSAVDSAMKTCFLYPDPACRELRSVASRYFSVPSEHILVGNGSNELIDLLIRLLCEPGDTVMTSEGAFIAYKICAKASRAQVVEVPLRNDYTINLQAFTEKLKNMKSLPKVVFIPNPNNPIGSYIPKAEVDEFLKEWGGNDQMLIVFDEAYTEFVDAEDFPKTSELLKFENVLVLKTLSKVFGLAGLRIGLLLGSEEVLSLIHRIRNPFNVNSLAQAAAAAALQDFDSIEKIKSLVISGRKDFEGFLNQMGLSFVPSQANFVFFDTKSNSLMVHDKLLQEGLILRPLVGYGFKSHLRITIGDEEQMAFAKNVFKKVF